METQNAHLTIPATKIGMALFMFEIRGWLKQGAWRYGCLVFRDETIKSHLRSYSSQFLLMLRNKSCVYFSISEVLKHVALASQKSYVKTSGRWKQQTSTRVCGSQSLPTSTSRISLWYSIVVGTPENGRNFISELKHIKDISKGDQIISKHGTF